jgi:UDP-GlcNAc:undecaprenyl-phosphate/decaprenyl-phosphate GlcNAc-1-phosphate transferase
VTMVRRRIAGRPMFIGDRSHIYDQLRDRGWSVPRVAVGMAAAQAAIAIIVVGVDRSLEPWQSLMVLIAVLAGSVVLLSRWGFLRTEPR